MLLKRQGLNLPRWAYEKGLLLCSLLMNTLNCTGQEQEQRLNVQSRLKEMDTQLVSLKTANLELNARLVSENEGYFARIDALLHFLKMV